MEVEPRPARAEYNAATRRETLRRFLLAVILPMALLFACVVALTALAATRPDQGVGSRSTFAQIATFFLLGPLCLFSLVQLALVAGLIFGVVKLSGVLPPAFYKVHQVLLRVQAGAERATTAAMRPLIAGHVRAAEVGRLARALRGGPGRARTGAP